MRLHPSRFPHEVGKTVWVFGNGSALRKLPDFLRWGEPVKLLGSPDGDQNFVRMETSEGRIAHIGRDEYETTQVVLLRDGSWAHESDEAALDMIEREMRIRMAEHRITHFSAEDRFGVRRLQHILWRNGRGDFPAVPG